MFNIFKRKQHVESTEPLGIAFCDYMSTGKDKKVMLSGLRGDKEISLKTSHFVNVNPGKKAIAEKVTTLAKGNCLDIGACSGHFSKLLQEKGFDVTALDISENCVEYIRTIGVKRVICEDIWNYTGEEFDTICIIDGTIGCVEDITNFPNFFNRIDNLLTDHGQVFISDNNFDAQNGLREWKGQFRYKNFVGKSFHWFNISLPRLILEVEALGWVCETILEQQDGLYLVRISRHQN